MFVYEINRCFQQISKLLWWLALGFCKTLRIIIVYGKNKFADKRGFILHKTQDTCSSPVIGQSKNLFLDISWSFSTTIYFLTTLQTLSWT